MLPRLPIVLFAAPLLAPVSTAQWSQAQLSQPRSGLVAARAGDLALFAGGLAAGGPSDVVDIYEVATGDWSVATLSLPRSDLAAAGSGSLALFGGGRDASGAASACVDLFDADTGLWTTAALSVARHDLAAAAVGDWVLFAGGQDESFAKHAVVDLFHVPSGAWSVGLLSEARSSPGAAVAGGAVFIAGGFWSIAADRIEPGAPWTVDYLSRKRGDLGATGVGDRALFAGGLDTGFLPTGTVDLFDTASGTMSAAALSKPRSGVAAASIEALALFAGGWADGGAPYAPDDTMDLFDTITGEWLVRSLPAPRARLAALALEDRVLFAGGLDPAQQPVDTVWIYRPPLPGRGFCFGAENPGACPCGNSAAIDEGCRNSTGRGGCLRAGGSARISLDDLCFEAEHLPPDQPSLLFAAVNRVNGGQGTPFGDGLRCTGGSARRLRTDTVDPAGRARFGPGLLARAEFKAGDLRHFQAWYRDPTGGPCGADFNLTNAVEVQLRP